MNGAVRATRDAIAEGSITATAAVEEALHRIAERDTRLHAVVALRVEDALREAQACEARLRAGAPARPLEGVPMLVKDLESVAGMPTRKGSLLLADSEPALEDDHVVHLLREAGAIVVGKTNLPEFATEGFTDNLLDGSTGNPWSTAHSPGGSSGGSAAALSAGMVPIATATDGGGSVRIPAAMCGLVGLKPTHGAVGRRPAHDWIDLSSSGPFATTVDDLRLLTSVLIGRANGDPASAPAPWDPLMHGVARPSHVIVAERTSPLGPLPHDVRAAFEDAVAAFCTLLPAPTTRVATDAFFGGLGDPDDDWFTLATAEHVQSLGRYAVVAGLDRMHPATAQFMRQGLDISIDAYLAARRRRTLYTRRLDDLLGPSGLLVTPTVASSGWLADGRLTVDGAPGMLPASVYSTAVQNVTGHPAISLPAGVFATGLPFGLQVTAARWRDDLLLDVAEAWERAFPWPRTAQGYDEFRVAPSHA